MKKRLDEETYICYIHTNWLFPYIYTYLFTYIHTLMLILLCYNLTNMCLTVVIINGCSNTEVFAFLSSKRTNSRLLQTFEWSSSEMRHHFSGNWKEHLSYFCLKIFKIFMHWAYDQISLGSLNSILFHSFAYESDNLYFRFCLFASISFHPTWQIF